MSALWAMKEAKNMNLRDNRRNLRAAYILETIFSNPTASIQQANGSLAGTKGAYRFVETEEFDEQDILAGHYQSTCNRIVAAGEDIVVLSDGMDISLTSLKKTTGLGQIGNRQYSRGIKTHNTLALSKEFIPLGLIDVKYWIRDPKVFGKKKLRKSLKIQDKETYSWIEALQKTENSLPKNIGYTFIGDGGADIYDVIAMQRRPNSSLLIHLTQDRNVNFTEKNPEEKLFDALDSAKSLGVITVALPRTPTRSAREVKLNIKMKVVDIKPPSNRKKENLPTLQITAISACEARKGKSKYTRKSKSKKRKTHESITWRLLTTKNVASLEEAADQVYLYAKRWLIERYHYILKEGCRIEKLQMESVENLKRTIALYSIIAWRLMYITYVARINPDALCTIAFSANEWQALWCYVKKKQQTPLATPTIKEAVLLLAKVGGFLNRKGDGEPGAKVIWRGILALDHITEMFVIFKGKNVGNG